jgi:hypothetical protein
MAATKQSTSGKPDHSMFHIAVQSLNAYFQICFLKTNMGSSGSKADSVKVGLQLPNLQIQNMRNLFAIHALFFKNTISSGMYNYVL